MEKSKGRIVKDGMGGFLNPPMHPEHFRSVQGYGNGRGNNDFSMSLSAAVDCEWLDDETRGKAKVILNSWNPLPIDHESVKDWIHNVLGYFKNCYTRDKNIRDVNNKKTFYIAKDGMPESEDKSFHLGVLLIQKYYPEYEPNDDDFEKAYWGKKP